MSLTTINPILAPDFQPLSDDLSALSELISTGITVKAADATWVQRTIIGSGAITVTHGNGVDDNPTIGISQATTSAVGAVELATVDESNTATDTARAVTPAGLANYQNINNNFVVPAGKVISYAPSDTEKARTVNNLISYRLNSATGTGAIVFTAPITSANVMHQFNIEGWIDYDSSRSIIKFTVYGYFKNNTWLFSNQINRGNFDPGIRWGITPDSKPCLIIGTETSNWSYPHIVISQALFSYVGVSDSYITGWTSSLVTDLTSYTGIVTPLESGPTDVRAQGSDNSHYGTFSAYTANGTLGASFGYGDGSDLIEISAGSASKFDISGFTSITADDKNLYRVHPLSLPDGIDLDSCTTDGFYIQGHDAYATLENNYPAPKAGLLRVWGVNTMLWQEYTLRGGTGNRKFYRAFYDTWTEWSEIFQGPIAALTDANALAVPGTYFTSATWTGSPFSGTVGSNQGYLIHYNWNASATYCWQEFRSVNSTYYIMYRRKDNGTWSDWFTYYNKNNPPTANITYYTNTVAVSTSNRVIINLTEDTTTLNTQTIYRVRMTTGATSTSTGIVYWIWYNGSSWQIYNASAGLTGSNRPEIELAASGTQLQVFTQHTSSYPINFTVISEYVGSSNNTVTAFGFNLESIADYVQAEFDERQIVSDVRLGTSVNVVWSSYFSSADGNFIWRIRTSGSSSPYTIASVDTKPIQKLINGSWATISG